MKLKLFFGSLVLTTIVVLLLVGLNSSSRRSKSAVRNLTPIATNLFFTSQLNPKDVPPLKERGIKTIVALRPDNEAKDQPSSSEIQKASEANGLGFHYIPVPHETIPDTAVTALTDVLAHEPTPTVLYCRTGRRAVRTFALAEASRKNGPSRVSILDMVQAAGFTADDLKDDIEKRIANRQPTTDAR